MKKTLLIGLLLTLYLRSAAQTKQIDGFLGIKFGSGKDQVLAAMKLRGSILDIKESSNNIQQYKNVKLATRQVDLFYVRFVDNKAFEADLLFLAPLEAQTIEFYDKIVEDISNVYGTGQAFKTFKYPYTEGDGYELTAIKTGNADFHTYWQLNNIISASITPPLGIKLLYQDVKLVEIAVEKQKQEQKADF
jgi:hypothetical protein